MVESFFFDHESAREYMWLWLCIGVSVCVCVAFNWLGSKARYVYIRGTEIYKMTFARHKLGISELPVWSISSSR